MGRIAKGALRPGLLRHPRGMLEKMSESRRECLSVKGVELGQGRHEAEFMWKAGKP
jgi:hypothetical protein